MILPDVLANKLSVVFCGSAVGTASAKAGAYYAGPGNKFWGILEQTGLTPRLLQPDEFRDLVKYGIGLTDLVKLQSGSDSAIGFSSCDPGELKRKITEYAPAFLCFNGKRAAQEFLGVERVDYGLQAEAIGRTRIFVAPSTSAAANRWWDANVWQQLADLVLGEPS